MSNFGPLTPTFPIQKSLNPDKPSPPPSPRLGASFFATSPMVSPKQSPFQSPFKSPTMPKSPTVLKSPMSFTPPALGRDDSLSSHSSGVLSPPSSNGVPVGHFHHGSSFGAASSTPPGSSSGGGTFSLYSSFIFRTANIIGPNRGSPTPPGSPKVNPKTGPVATAATSSGRSNTSSIAKLLHYSSTSFNSSFGESTSETSPPVVAIQKPTVVKPSYDSPSENVVQPNLLSTGSLKARNDSNNNKNKSNSSTSENKPEVISTNTDSTVTTTGPNSPGWGTIKPPVPIANVSPYKYQLRSYLYPRHITTEHVVFSHKTKVGGRSLYFFSPANRGGLSKPVFTTRETLAHLLQAPGTNGDDGDDYHDVSFSPSRFGSPSRKKGRGGEEMMTGVVCTMKRVHLMDPACDLGISVWRGRGPKEGLPAPHRPPEPMGPALLVEVVHQRDGMAVAAAIGGDILYLMPSRPDLEARSTEICVQSASISCVGEGVVWYTVRDYTRRKTAQRSNHHTAMSPKIPLGRKGVKASTVDS